MSSLGSRKPANPNTPSPDPATQSWVNRWFTKKFSVLDPARRVQNVETINFVSGAKVTSGGEGIANINIAAPVSGVIVEKLFLSSLASAGATSTTVLQTGRQYIITVQGTYSFFNQTLPVGSPQSDAMFPTSTAGRVSLQVGNDAETVFATVSGSAKPIGHLNSFQMNLGSGLQHIEPVGGPYSTPQPNFFYTYNVTGQGSTVNFLIVDSPYTDNYGELLITIQTVGGSSGGGGGGSQLPDPSSEPDGSWLITSSGVAEWDTTPPVTSFNTRTGAVTPGNADYLAVASGLTGATATTRYVGATTSGAPASGTFVKGDFIIDQTGAVWVCTTAGSPGTWTKTGSGSGVSSLDSITGAVTLVAGSGTVITDNSPSAGNITIGVSGTTSGSELSYTQVTSPVSITSTTESAGTQLVAPGAITFNGSAVIAHFFCPDIATAGAALGNNVIVALFEGSTEIGRLGVMVTPAASNMRNPMSAFYRFTPSAGSHTYKVTASVSNTTGTPQAEAGSGGTGGWNPMFLRFTYA